MPVLPAKSKRKGKPRSTRLLLLTMLLFWLMILGGLVAVSIRGQDARYDRFSATTTSIMLTNDEVAHLLTQTAEAAKR